MQLDEREMQLDGTGMQRDKTCGKKTLDEEYDMIVVGGGPAGLFSALNSRMKGRRVLLLEKKSSCGRKLLISGFGRCNITHDGDISSFLDHYGDHGRFLRPALLGFTNADLISFFEGRGLSMTRTDGGKVFPSTMRSRDVLDILLKECRTAGVDIACGCEVESVLRSSRSFEVSAGGDVFRSRLLLIAAGGLSYPATGSSGDGYRFAEALGHSISDLGPALTPMIIKDFPFSDLAGISFPDMDISLHLSLPPSLSPSPYRENAGRKIRAGRGDLLFTHQGLSGPGILDLSRHIRAGGILKLSFLKGRSREDLDSWLQERAREEGGRGVKSALMDLSLPERLIVRLIDLSKIPPGLKLAGMTREMRFLIAENLTAFPLVISGLGGYDVAMATRGGVSLEEVSRKTMESKIVKGLYLAGEVLDIDGDTGGYNLQAAFSTGMLAARSIRRRWEEEEVEGRVVEET